MIRRRFSVFPGVGPVTERAIWGSGIPDWQRFLEAGEVPVLAPSACARVRQHVRLWSRALGAGDAAFFARNLAHPEHWHLYEALREGARYLDIETTGLSPYYGEVTVVGISDGRDFQALVQGKDLTARNLRRALKGCRLLVTYYGSVFDLSFLRRKFPAIDWGVPHFDLCFAGRRLGLTGGMKRVERRLGIRRPNSLAEVDGFEAVRLWHRYRAGSAAALKKLVRYNEEDTRNLARIAPVVYQRLCRQIGG